MPRSASKLAPTHEGGFIARKVIPADVRAEYAKLYGQRVEERLNTGPMPVLHARAKHREWSSEIEARIANIRADRKGEGRMLTPQEARALAGEWYIWFAARMAANNWPADVWEDYEGQVRSELYGPAMAGGVFSGDPLDLWERDSAMRDRVRPIIADEAKSHQFLAAKGLTLDATSRTMFLDYVTRDFFAAVGLLARRARGDFGPDKRVEQFPQSEGVGDPSLSAWALFGRWIEKAQPAALDRRSLAHRVPTAARGFSKYERRSPTARADAALGERVDQCRQVRSYRVRHMGQFSAHRLLVGGG
jgi:hypothetical protein